MFKNIKKNDKKDHQFGKKFHVSSGKLPFLVYNNFKHRNEYLYINNYQFMFFLNIHY